jgi:hypothetical protein
MMIIEEKRKKKFKFRKFDGDLSENIKNKLAIFPLLLGMYADQSKLVFSLLLFLFFGHDFTRDIKNI